MRLETFTDFNPDKVADYFTKRGWPVATIPAQSVNLVPVDNGASLECGDGRFDKFQKRKLHGVRILGGINAIMATLTGGNEVGLIRANQLIRRAGVTAGTHSAENGGCAHVELWMDGKLESAVYPYEFDRVRDGLPTGKWLRGLMKECGGAHIRLNGDHEEEGVRINPFRGLTEKADDGARFRIDDWFMADLCVPTSTRLLKIAEVVEKRRPDAARLEIIVP